MWVNWSTIAWSARKSISSSGKIDRRFHVYPKLDEALLQRVDALGENALHGSQRCSGSGIGLRADQVGDGFGLSQVHAPIEKCSLAELAG
jgi:hypothetical protein